MSESFSFSDLSVTEVVKMRSLRAFELEPLPSHMHAFCM